MKKFKYLLKIIVVICICFIGVLIILFNSTFGNFTVTVYDLFINPFLFFVYLILTLFFILWTKKHARKEYYYLFLIPLIFTFISYLWKQNIHKNILLKAIIEDSKGSSITLFDNNTFEIKVQYQHGADFKKGKYEKKGNEIYLKENNIVSLTDSLFTQKYVINKNEKLEPLDSKKFKTITVYNSGFKQEGN